MGLVSLVRGYRNNNPGNIRHGEQWLGLCSDQPDKSFCSFLSPEFGIRAMARTLRTYYTKHQLTNVRAIINRWAPPKENKTVAYVDSVCAYTGLTPDKDFSLTNPLVMQALIKAIIRHELGSQPYSDELIDIAINWERDGIPLNIQRP